jgi:hypothetical protein
MILGSKKSGKQRHVIRGERFPAFGVPHHTDHRMICVPDSLDHSIVRNCPSLQWGVNLRRSEVMKAVHFHALAIDRNTLPVRHMAANPFEGDTSAVLDHLHAPANAQNGQVLALGQVEKRSLGFVALGSIAAISSQVISTGQDDAAHLIADVQCGVHRIGDGNWKQPAPEEEFYPDLIEAIAAGTMWGVDYNPLGDCNGLHDTT